MLDANVLVSKLFGLVQFVTIISQHWVTLHVDVEVKNETINRAPIELWDSSALF